MSIRRSKLPLALTLALLASQAQALGLGQMQVKSGLGQPLVAEIPILSATPDELEKLDVRLASPEAFERVGLERPVSLSANLQMSVVRDGRGLPVIRVSTPGRFNEPFLSFLVEASWGRGSLVREFTALVDPPYIAPAVIRPLQAPTVSVAPPPPTLRPISAPPSQNPVTVVQREEPVAIPAPSTPAPAPAVVAAPPPPPMPAAPPPAPVAIAPEPTAEFEASPFSQPLPDIEPAPAPAPAPAPIQQIASLPPLPAQTPPQPAVAAPMPAPAPVIAPPPEPPKDQYGPVQDGQTLWSVAQGLRTDDSITVNQMMLALQRANPGAFINDNVNLLKSGAVLRIPAREEAVAVLPEEAAALIRQQSGMRPVPQPEQGLAREARPEPAAAKPKPAPKPESRPEPKPAAAAPKPKPEAAAKPVAQAAPARQGRLEIVPPAGKSGARSSQSGASASGGGTELRAELSQTKEDLAAREAEVVELKSRVADLEKLQGDSKSLIEMQNSELKALRDRLAEIERQQQAETASSPPAPVQPVAAAPAEAAAAATQADASTEVAMVAAPWYQHPASIGGAILLLGLIVWWLSRRGSSARVASLTRRMGEGTAPPASLAMAADKGHEDEPAGPEAPPADEDFEMLGLQDMVNMNPRDLEAHLNLLRYLHRKGDAAAFEAAATDMRGQIGNTTDPRWREVVVMGMGLLPGHPLFSQLGWNAPKFTGPEMAEKPAPAPAKPEASPAPADAVPSWMRTTAPSQIPSRGDEAALEAAAEDEIDLTPLEGGNGDIHRKEAELQAYDEASATKIELAKAYLDIGDIDGARAMLEDVLVEGSPAARDMAASILKELG